MAPFACRLGEENENQITRRFTLVRRLAAWWLCDATAIDKRLPGAIVDGGRTNVSLG
jgi:hypothetical protein